MSDWWRVEVTTHDGTLVSIEPEMLAGIGSNAAPQATAGRSEAEAGRSRWSALLCRFSLRRFLEFDMQPHQQRVVDEKAELDAKREKLGAFKNTDLFAGLPWQEQERLNTQAHIMTMYSAVLGERIAAFGA